MKISRNPARAKPFERLQALTEKTVWFSILTLLFFSYPEAQSAWSPDTQARILGGFPPREKNSLAELNGIGWPGKENVATHWGRTERYSDGTTNLSAPESRKIMDAFFSESLGAARTRTQNLLYLFGGPDVYFPNLLFPGHRKLLLVGLEKPGTSCNPFPHERKKLLEGMAQVSRAYKTILRLGYFNTGEMEGHLREFGAAPIICVGLVAQGFRITGLTLVSLDANGSLAHAEQGMHRGIRIGYLKHDGTAAEVIYLSMNLSNIALAETPGFVTFLRQSAFQTAYYKAASYLSHQNDQFGKINELVLQSVAHVVQNDDSIPLRAFDSSWRLSLYGIYTKPDQQFATSTQDDLKALYAAEICRSGDERDKALWKALWQSDCTGARPVNKFHSVSWRGTLPFRYGYAGFSGPGMTRTNRPPPGIIITWSETRKWSNLVVAEKVLRSKQALHH